MDKKTTDLIKTMAGGAAAGLLVGMVTKNMNTGRRSAKKKAEKAVDAMSNVVDTVAYMFK